MIEKRDGVCAARQHKSMLPLQPFTGGSVAGTRGMPTAPQMTPEQFDQLLPRLGRLAQGTVKVARAVLVDGMTTTQAAERHSMTRQRVHGIVQRFRAAAAGAPTSWRRVEVWLPPELADQVEQMAQQALTSYAENPSSAE